jgi:hypothetical protein
MGRTLRPGRVNRQNAESAKRPEFFVLSFWVPVSCATAMCVPPENPPVGVLGPRAPRSPAGGGAVVGKRPARETDDFVSSSHELGHSLRCALSIACALGELAHTTFAPGPLCTFNIAGAAELRTIRVRRAAQSANAVAGGRKSIGVFDIAKERRTTGNAFLSRCTVEANPSLESAPVAERKLLVLSATIAAKTAA